METTQEKVYDLEYGYSKGYIQKKLVYLKPVGNKFLTLMLKEKNNPVHGFMYEGSRIDWCLPMNERQQYYDPFKDDDEKKFFEAQLRVSFDLNHNKPDCIWNCGLDLTTRVVFEVDANIKTIGYKFDLNKPADVIKYKVAKMQYNVGTSDKEVRPHHTWILIDKETEDTAKLDITNDSIEIYKALGAMEQHVDKMREFLNLYIIENKLSEEIPANMTQNAFKVRLQQIIDKDKKGFLAVVRDENKEYKLLLISAIKAGAINKLGVNGFELPGVGKWDYMQAIEALKLYKKKRDEDETYDQLLARIDLANGVLPSKK
jgi:hypothetical protein